MEKTKQGRPPRKNETASTLIAVRLTPEERERYQRTADASGLSLSDWIRGLCEAAQSNEPLELFSVESLVALVPGSTKRLWLARWVPELIQKRVLVKRGKAWLGRRSQIEAALLETNE